MPQLADVIAEMKSLGDFSDETLQSLTQESIDQATKGSRPIDVKDALANSFTGNNFFISPGNERHWMSQPMRPD
jgi:hypothetical protein